MLLEAPRKLWGHNERKLVCRFGFPARQMMSLLMSLAKRVKKTFERAALDLGVHFDLRRPQRPHRALKQP